MLDIMFDVHDMPDIGTCRITRDTVIQKRPPVFELRKASA